MKWLKGILIFAMVITVLYFGFISSIVFNGDIANYQSRIEFNTEAWKAWEETEATMSLRWDMRHSLLEQHKLVGMTVPEVVELLGEPSRKSPSEMSYYLGMARSGIDTGALNLTVEDGIIINYRIWQG